MNAKETNDDHQLARHSVNFADPSTGTTISTVEIPDTCPHCRRLSVLNLQVTTFNWQRRQVQVSFMCSFRRCTGFCLAYYSVEQDTNGVFIGRLVNTEPPIIDEIAIPKFAEEISPDFVSIFNEATEAKNRQLSQIAGPGFRKAFEFLLKDYAKSLVTETDAVKKAEIITAIERAFSGKVVAEHIPDKRVQKVAKRALWVGNDETHYLRKWIDRDITDLITLIKLTLDWIEIERLSNDYENEMPD